MSTTTTTDTVSNSTPDGKLIFRRTCGTLSENGRFEDFEYFPAEQKQTSLNDHTPSMTSNSESATPTMTTQSVKAIEAGNSAKLASNMQSSPLPPTPSSFNLGDNRTTWLEWCKKKCDDWDPSLVLKNEASVARDHLANERTFLAWLRTSLSFISIGVAITQLFRIGSLGEKQSGNAPTIEDRMGKPLGVAFVVLGVIFLIFGVLRYFHSQHLMTKGKFPASRGSIIFGSILTSLILCACFVVIIVADSRS